MGEELVSIIVPVYHVEAYLERCLASLCAQTHTRLEILAVLDGGTAQEAEIAREVARRDARVRVIAQENRGLSAARNAGLDAARGEWVMFVDGDDRVEPDFCSIPLEAAHRYGADLVTFGCRMDVEGANAPGPVCTPGLPEGYATLEAQLRALMDGRLMPNVWCRLFRRSLFEGVRFPVGELWEDVAVLHELIGFSRAGAVLHAPLYHYLQRQGAYTKVSADNARRWRYPQYLRRYRYIKERFPSLTACAAPGLISAANQYGVYCARRGLTGELAIARQTLKGERVPLAGASRRSKWMYRLMLHCPHLHRLLACRLLK